MVLMEALGSGVPVVTTPVNGIPELVEDGETGVLVPPGRADLLADAIERLLEEPDLRSALARRGRGAVVAEFDIRHIGPSIAELFARRRAPASAEGRVGEERHHPLEHLGTHDSRNGSGRSAIGCLVDHGR